MGPKSAKSAKYRVFCGYTWKNPGIPGKSPGCCRFPRFCLRFCPRPALRLRPQGKSRVSRMEHQTPSVFPGNFRKRKVLGTLCFPFCLPEKLVQANQCGRTRARPATVRRALQLGDLRRWKLKLYIFSSCVSFDENFLHLFFRASVL